MTITGQNGIEVGCASGNLTIDGQHYEGIVDPIGAAFTPADIAQPATYLDNVTKLFYVWDIALGDWVTVAQLYSTGSAPGAFPPGNTLPAFHYDYAKRQLYAWNVNVPAWHVLPASVTSDAADTTSLSTDHLRVVIAAILSQATGAASAALAATNSLASGAAAFVAASDDATASGDTAAIIGSSDTVVAAGTNNVIAASTTSDSNGDKSFIAASGDSTAGATVADGSNAVISSTGTYAGGTRTAVVASANAYVEGTNNGLMATVNSTVPSGTSQTLILASSAVEAVEDHTVTMGYGGGFASTANRTIQLRAVTGNIEIAGALSSSVAFPGLTELLPNLFAGELGYGRLVALSFADGQWGVALAADGDRVLGIVKHLDAVALLLGDGVDIEEGRYVTGQFGEKLFEEIPNPAYQDASTTPDTPPTIRVPQETDAFQQEKRNGKIWMKSDNRTHYTAVELVGRAHVVVSDETAVVGDYLAAGQEGTAVVSRTPTNLILLELPTGATSEESESVNRVGLALITSPQQ